MTDWTRWVLLAGLVALPAAAIPLHLRLHATIPWILYATLLDILLVTPLLYLPRTRLWGFYLNTVLAAVGFLFHLMYSPPGTLSDQLFLVSDFAIGYALFRMED
jgi:hypothetical protein